MPAQCPPIKVSVSQSRTSAVPSLCLTDAVFERKIKLVAPVHHLVAFLLSVSATLELPTSSIDVNPHVFCEGTDKTFSITLGVTVRDKLSYSSSSSLKRETSSTISTRGLTFLRRFAGEVFILSSKLINNISQILSHSLQSLNQAVGILDIGILSVGNRNVEERFHSWQRIYISSALFWSLHLPEMFKFDHTGDSRLK